MNDERFDALWADMKARVKEARGDRDKLIYTDSHQTNAHVSVWEGDRDGSCIRLADNRGTMRVNCGPEDLRTIAAHCLAAAEEIDEARGVSTVKAMVSEALAPLGDRFPADDEQKRA